MKSKTIRWVLCLVALTALLCGCGTMQTEGQHTQPTLNTGPLISTGPTSPSDAVTDITEQSGETQPPPSLEPVTYLSGTHYQTIPQLLSLGEGAVLSCRNDYEEGKGIVNFLEVIDVYQDKVLLQAQNTSPRELVEQQFSDGAFILRDLQTGSFSIYDRRLQVTGQFTAPNAEGYFSYDLKNYYFVENNVLYRMDIASGNYARMALEYDLRLERLVGVHPTREILIAKCYLSFYSEITGVCAIDCKTGRFLLLRDDVSHLWLEGDTFYAAVTNETIYGSDIVYGSLSGGILQKASTATLGSDTVSYSMLQGSGIMLHRTVADDDLSTTIYDLSGGGISSKLAQYDYLTSTLGAVYLPQEQLIFGVYPLDGAFHPVVIDPKVLKYEKSLNLYKETWAAMVDRALILNYLSEVEGPALPDSLSALRQRADALEDQFGISIRMENQTLGLYGSYAAVNADPVSIGNALTALEQALSKYPEGFLAQFQNGIREGGLNFCLTGPIQGSLNPVGKATQTGSRYDLAIDITEEELEGTIHHELWHAIEMVISTDTFNTPQWQAANPQGFLYYGHYDSGYRQLTQWTYAKSGAQCYFVDAYSRIDPREDRARLMESVMTTDASELLRSTALQKKLSMMSDAIRDHFNTKGWATPLWAQYL